MKILLITKNYHGWLASGELDYQLELARQVDVTFLGQGYPTYTRDWMSLPDFERDYGPFDVIYYSWCTTENPGYFKDVAATKAPKVGYIHDGHNYREAMVKRIRNWDTSLILFRSWAAHYYEYASLLDCPMKFHPQAVNPDLFKDYGLPKAYDVNFTGLVMPHYPLRVKMQHRLHQLRKEGMTVKMSFHPGYGNNWETQYDALKPKGALWREDYAQAMQQSRITLTTGGKWDVLVRRYFEALATKSLLLAPTPYHHDRVGLMPYRHFIPVRPGNWEKELHYYLQHYDQFYTSIVEPAYKWVHQHHTTPVRVRQLLDIFEQVLTWQPMTASTITALT